MEHLALKKVGAGTEQKAIGPDRTTTKEQARPRGNTLLPTLPNHGLIRFLLVTPKSPKSLERCDESTLSSACAPVEPVEPVRPKVIGLTGLRIEGHGRSTSQTVLTTNCFEEVLIQRALRHHSIRT